MEPYPCCSRTCFGLTNYSCCTASADDDEETLSTCAKIHNNCSKWIANPILSVDLSSWFSVCMLSNSDVANEGGATQKAVDESTKLKATLKGESYTWFPSFCYISGPIQVAEQANRY